MKKLNKLTMLTVAAALSLTAACVSPQQEDRWDLEECADAEKCEEQQAPQVSGTYVSGHLGHYRDCPGDGYSTQDTDTAGDAAAGACAPDAEECGEWTGNCEDAQLTVRLQNTGEAEARGLQVATIELFDADGAVRAELPLMQMVDTQTGETFDGTLDADEDVTLRVEFQGPENPYTLLNTSSPDGDQGRSTGDIYGTIDITFTADNHGDVVVESTALYPVPSVDT